MLLGINNVSAQFQIVVPMNKTWKFEQSNLDLGTAWRNPGFDDTTAGWGTGAAPLGFPANEVLQDGFTVATLMNRTTNGVQPRTYYFRTTFVFTNDPTGVTLIASNLIDDAAVFWLNGVEIGRVAFNVGTVVTFATPGDRGASEIATYGYDIFTNNAPGLIQGTNTYAVEVHQTGNNSSDAIMASRLMAVIPTPITITAQPTNVTSTENRVLSIAVVASGSTPRYQWYKGTNPPALLTDATNAVYTIANTALADTGNYFVVVSNGLNVVTSQVARITISNDTNGPVLLSVKGDESFQKIILTWDETIAAGSATEASNYIVEDSNANAVTINSISYFGNVVVLHVPALQPDALYNVEADSQSDLVGNTTLTVGTPVGDVNGVATNFNTWVISPGFTHFQAYLGLPANQSISSFVAMPVYPDGPTFSFYTNVLNWPQTAPVNLDQYAMRFSGLFIAPETGTHQFDPAHDDDMRLRVYASEDPNGTFTELAAACCTGLTGGPTLDIAMVAGSKYYYELIVREFGGGDVAGLSVTLPSSLVSSPISPQYLAAAVDPVSAQNVGFTQHPQNTTVEENHTASFSVVTTNSGGGSTTYLWQRSAGGPFTTVAATTVPTYTTPNQTLANHGDLYRVIAQVLGRTATSSTATLSVIADATLPRVTSVRGGRNLNTIQVTFNERMNAASATTIGHYTLLDSNAVPVTLGVATLGVDETTVTIGTAAQNPGALYTLTVSGVTDLAGNANASTNFTFQVWTYSRRFVLKELYLGLSPSTVAISELRSSPNYPNSPSIVRYGETPELNTFDEFEGYGARLSGVWTPPVSGNYVFYMSADDNGELWLSTNASPANIVYIAREPVYAGRRVWTGESAGGSRLTTPSPSGGLQANISTNISLVAGQQYYFETLVKEGGGGDNLALSWQIPGGPVPVNGSLPTGGLGFAALADPVGAFITISQQPASTNIQPGQTASFALRAAGTNVNGNAPLVYQWQRKISGVWQDLSGANSSNYVTAVLGAPDNGAQYRALIFIPGTETASAVATVAVGAPRLSIRLEPSDAVISWSSAFTGFSLESTPVLPAVAWTSNGPIVLTNAENTVRVPRMMPAKFFRVRQD